MLRQIVPIETVRLLLRAFTSDDGEAVFLFHSDPDVANYTGGLRSREHSLATLSRWIDRFNSRGWGPLAVVERGESRPIGWCGVQPMTHTNDFELFFGYVPRVWGKGYATEAASALIEAGFRAMNIARIVARVHPENHASRRVLEKVGMVRRGSVFNDIYGGIVDLFVIERT